MESLIPLVKKGTITDRWTNGKVAQFKYDESKVRYQLIEITPDGKSYIVSIYERTTENCPVVAKGIVAYLIHNWGRPEEEIYRGFYELCLSEFKVGEEKKPGAFKRNLNDEHYDRHMKEENERAAYSQKIYPFLSVDDSELIDHYLASYFDFISIKYGKKSSEEFHQLIISQDAQSFVEKLYGLFGGKKGKSIAIMIIALEKLNKIAYTDRTNLYNAIRQRFGNIGTDTSINEYLSPYKTKIATTRKPILLDTDIQPFIIKIQNFGC